jgi:hypothetical protein
MSYLILGWCFFAVVTVFTLTTIIYECVLCSSLFSVGEEVSKLIKKLNEEEKPINKENLYSMYV